jgi:hypothetical protein
MKKWIPLLLVVFLALAIVLIRKCQDQKDPSGPDITNHDKGDRSGKVNRDRGFDRRTTYLEYSKHAKCRMKCRQISESEVEEIMRDGKINYSKSDLKNARCPRYALEGMTHDNQRVRIVFAQCNESTVVVTVIDLETEFACDCPGDDEKFKNRN